MVLLCAGLYIEGLNFYVSKDNKWKFKDPMP